MASAARYLTECSICCEQFDDPQRLVCDHTFCRKCLKRLIKYNQINCPTCYVISIQNEIKPDFRIAQFIEALADQKKEITNSEDGLRNRIEQKCDLCLSEYPFFLCSECDQVFCMGCKDIHSRSKSTAKHNVVSIKEKEYDVRKQLKEYLQKLEKARQECRLQLREVDALLRDTSVQEDITTRHAETLKRKTITDISRQFHEFDNRISKTFHEHSFQLNTTKYGIKAKADEIDYAHSTIIKRLDADSLSLVKDRDSLIKSVRKALDSLPKLIDSSIPTVGLERNPYWSKGSIAELKVNYHLNILICLNDF